MSADRKRRPVERPAKTGSNRIVIRVIFVVAAVVVITAIVYSAANGVLFTTNGR